MFTSTLILKCVARRRRRGKPAPRLYQITWTSPQPRPDAAWHRVAVDMLNRAAAFRRNGRFQHARNCLTVAREATVRAKGCLP